VYCRFNYQNEIENYIVNNNLQWITEDIGACKRDHSDLENFVEEGNAKYIECGDLKYSVCYNCNEAFKKKASKWYVTLKCKKPGYTCENRNRGCRIM